MKVDPYLHAVLLLHGAGKEINKDSIMAVLKAAGIEPEEARAKVLAEAVKDVNFEDLLKNVAVSAPAAPAAPPAGAGAQAEKKEEKKEEKKSEEEAAAGLANLFG